MIGHGTLRSRDTGHRHEAAYSHCAFSALLVPVLGGAGPLLLLAAIAHLLLIALLGHVEVPVLATRRLRPPLRAPPFSR